MHKSSYLEMQWFEAEYANKLTIKNKNVELLDVGSYNVNGSYKKLFPCEYYNYTGLDMEAGANVDIVLSHPYDWSSVETERYDIVISGQAFEHIEFFWETMSQMVRVLRQDGMLCIIAPQGFGEHRYPVDCYRFFTDGMIALSRYFCMEIIHAYTNHSKTNCADSVLIAKKPYAGNAKIIDTLTYKCVPGDHSKIKKIRY